MWSMRWLFAWYSIAAFKMRWASARSSGLSPPRLARRACRAVKLQEGLVCLDFLD